MRPPSHKEPRQAFRSLLSAILPLATLAAVWTAEACAADRPAKPNIVFIFIDDMGYGDIGPFGSKKNRTPQIDRMSREGVRFTSFYAAPVCSVSRSQVMTGCYGARVSVPGVFPPGHRYGLNSDEHTVAELLRAQGYATMCVGKWHLGDQPEFLPTRHGFDHYLGIPYSNDMNRKAADTGNPVVPLLRDEKVIELLDGAGQERLVGLYTEEAVSFIRGNCDRPFFLYLPHAAMHVPLHPGPRFQGKSTNGAYGDWVEEVDWSVGRVLDTLRELKLDDRTLVMFSSDNGPWLIKGKDGGEAGPLRGGKGSTWEGGVRVPTLAWWPGRVPAGGACDTVAGTIDLLPTFTALAGGAVPADRKIDGRDITRLLLGETRDAQREAHFYYLGYKLQAVRSGPWKLALGPQAMSMGLKDGGISEPGMRLYNLDADIGETTSVGSQHPEVVKRLQSLAAPMAADIGDGAPGPGVRPAGEVASPVTIYPTTDSPRSKRVGRKAARKAPVEGAPPASPGALKVGDVLEPGAAPRVAMRPLTITCEIEPRSPDGIIVAHGGTAVGYALYLSNGCPVFAVHPSGKAGTTTVAASEGPTGAFAVQASLGADGSMRLAVNGAVAAEGNAGSPLSREPVENLCVGLDDGKPVANYGGAMKFSGTIHNLKINTGSPK